VGTGPGRLARNARVGHRRGVGPHADAVAGRPGGGGAGHRGAQKAGARRPRGLGPPAGTNGGVGSRTGASVGSPGPSAGSPGSSAVGVSGSASSTRREAPAPVRRIGTEVVFTVVVRAAPASGTGPPVWAVTGSGQVRVAPDACLPRTTASAPAPAPRRARPRTAPASQRRRPGLPVGTSTTDVARGVDGRTEPSGRSNGPPARARAGVSPAPAATAPRPPAGRASVGTACTGSCGVWATVRSAGPRARCGSTGASVAKNSSTFSHRSLGALCRHPSMASTSARGNPGRRVERRGRSCSRCLTTTP
jgi:hypothetical protein